MDDQITPPINERLQIPMPEDESTRLVLTFLLDQVYSLHVGAMRHSHEIRNSLPVTETIDDLQDIHRTVSERLARKWAEKFDPQQEAQ